MCVCDLLSLSSMKMVAAVISPNTILLSSPFLSSNLKEGIEQVRTCMFPLAQQLHSVQRYIEDIHTHIHTYAHTRIHTLYMYTHAHTHFYAHTCMYTPT